MVISTKAISAQSAQRAALAMRREYTVMTSPLESSSMIRPPQALPPNGRGSPAGRPWLFTFTPRLGGKLGQLRKPSTQPGRVQPLVRPPVLSPAPSSLKITPHADNETLHRCLRKTDRLSHDKLYVPAAPACTTTHLVLPALHCPLPRFAHHLSHTGRV